MNRDEYWDLVESCRPADSPDELATAVKDKLCNMPLEQVLAFDQVQQELMQESYTWRLWGAAYLINGGCSDDGFDYFRGWLITQGRDTFERALADPETLADLDIDPEDSYCECENMVSAAFSAYYSRTGEYPPISPTLSPGPGLGEGWDFDDDDEMQARYPRLFEKFG